MNKELSKTNQARGRSIKRSGTAALCLLAGVAVGLGLAQLQTRGEAPRADQARRIAELEARLARAEADQAAEPYTIPEAPTAAPQSGEAPPAPNSLAPAKPAAKPAPKPAPKLGAAKPASSDLRQLARGFGATGNDLKTDALAEMNVMMKVLDLKKRQAFDYDAVVALLSDEDPEVRRGALKILRYGKLTGADPATLNAARDALLAIIEDPSSSALDRNAALSALPTQGEDPALRARLQTLAEENSALGLAAIERLGDVPGGRDYLAQLAQSSEGARRKSALQALVSKEGSDLSDPAQRALVLRLARDPDPALRAELFRQMKFADLMNARAIDPQLMDGLAGVYAEERSEEALASLDATLSFNASPENAAALERWAADPSVPEERRARLAELAKKGAEAKDASPVKRAFEAIGEMLKDVDGLGMGEELDKALGKQGALR